MKAVVYKKFGGPDVLEYVDHPLPERTLGQVTVKIKATSVNPVDCKIRQGKLPFAKKEKVQVTRVLMHVRLDRDLKVDHSWPCLQILGGDFSGVVEAADADSKVTCKKVI